MFFLIIPTANQRGKWLRRYGGFQNIGTRIFYQPRKLPGEPHLISFGDNVVVASNVTFITHDVMHHMFNVVEEDSTEFYLGAIKVGNNVFIGSNSTILPNVSIGNNVIIGAGSVVTRDVRDGVIIAGNPAKEISNFEKIYTDRKNIYHKNRTITRDKQIESIWEQMAKR